MKVQYVLAGLTVVLLLSGCGKKVEFEGEPWYANVQRENKEIILFNEYPTDSMAEQWEYGSCPESGHDLAEDDSYYYVENPTDESKLYRIKKDGSFAKEKLLDLQAEDINVINGKIYFSNYDETTEPGIGIFCMNVDGSELEMITDAYPYDMKVVNDWIYFIDYNTDGIYKIHNKGKELIQLTDQECSGLKILENQIFTYIKTEDNSSDDEDKWELASLDVNGQNKQSYGEGESYSISEGFIYVLREDGLYKMPIGQPDQEILLTDELEEISSIKVIGEELFYVTEQQKLARYNLTSGENKVYTSISHVTGYSIFDDMIEVYYVDGTEKKVTVNHLDDGTSVAFYK